MTTRPSSPSDTEALLDAAASGDRRALARLLTAVEAGGDEAKAATRAAHPRAGRAHTVGMTGAPGAGKSTLTNALVARLRVDDDAVAVLAVDPTSPFSGGAILGDRVRMGAHALDEGVFIRSMASRGHLGGLALSTPEAARVLDAAGFGWVLIETVGVGQVEVEVAGAADTTVVVVNPGWGDGVQANKAGLLEVADLFVINKADRPGVDDTRRDLEAMLDLTQHPDGWRPPVLATVAPEGDGVDELAGHIRSHRAHLVEGGGLDERRRLQTAAEVRRIVVELLDRRAGDIVEGPAFDAVHRAVLDREIDPWTAAERLLDG